MEIIDSLAQKVTAYQPSDRAIDLLNNTSILLLVAISGGGKDTIKAHLLATGKYQHIISYTTRAPRTNHGVLEQDGVDYHFIDLTTAQRMLDDGAYIEADLYADNIYGTGIADIATAQASGKIATTDITIEGAVRYLELAPTIKVVFLLPPSYEIWMKRLMSRYGGKPNQRDIYLRMQEAVDEITLAMQSEKMYIVVNDDLDKTVELVDDIANDKPVEPHYGKAMEVAQSLLDRLAAEHASAKLPSTLDA